MAHVDPFASPLTVEVAVGMAPRQVARCSLTLPLGVTVRSALEESGLLDQPDGPNWANIASGQWFVGVWGRRADLDHVLRDRDRIELYRGLKVDPKEARRLRYRAAGERVYKGKGRVIKYAP